MKINGINQKSFITAVPNFFEIQLNSFCWFLEYGLGEELNKFSSVLDLNKNLEIRVFGNERLLHQILNNPDDPRIPISFEILFLSDEHELLIYKINK